MIIKPEYFLRMEGKKNARFSLFDLVHVDFRSLLVDLRSDFCKGLELYIIDFEFFWHEFSMYIWPVWERRFWDWYCKRFSHYKRNNILSIYFGVPGAGKTTMAAWLSRRDLRHRMRVLSNVPIVGTERISPNDDIGHYDISDCRLIIDEAAIEYNSRNFAKFPQSAQLFYRFHRHYGVAVDVFSQSWDSVDKVLRSLSQRMYVLHKSLIPFCVAYKRIGMRVDISKSAGSDTGEGQIIDRYFWVPFSYRLIFSPPLWKLFNSYDAPALPKRPFPKWETSSGTYAKR